MKRSAVEGAVVAIQEEKRQKEGAGSIVVTGKSSKMQVVRARTSDLEAPVMKLEGHKREILTMRFNPNGNYLASGGHDQELFVWNVYGNCQNLYRLKGHEKAVTELVWNESGTKLMSASADKTVAIWDTEKQVRLKKIKASREVVNCLSTSTKGDPLLAAGGDDATTRLWDTRAPKNSVQKYEGVFPVTGVAISHNNDQIFTADTSGIISVWESRKEDILFTLPGHTDIVTGIKISPDGSFLLSNSVDNTLRKWDVRAFVPGGDAARCVDVFQGHCHGDDVNLLRAAWHPSGDYVSCGSSAPPMHYIWNTSTKKAEYILPGHRAPINDVDFHPDGFIFGSCSTDRTIYLGELQES
eukprot:TRINITY_DN12250_c0_g1_i2.p1 TRINITY_DN12250_c0_g1~~TRINITY_DN12250_c0_g1_i2.p1  ORF type:complete len:367 (+),score=49.49 TRINITY_DN12250_c0_g1_i2:37-1101(+)